MEQEPTQPGLFWVALICVGLVLVMILAKPLLGIRQKNRRWGLFLALASVVAAGSADRLSAPPAGPQRPSFTTPTGAGWDDAYVPHGRPI